LAAEPTIRFVTPDAEAAPAVEGLRDHPVSARPASLATAIEPLLMPAAEAARLCGISEASWYRLKSAGMLPAPVKLGGRVLWRIEDLRLWIALGCPSRVEFEARRPAANGNGRK
jgi:predicted DNA-binding transcriptional regulator AlpA